MTRTSGDIPILRRPDGSIDIDFYARRGAALRMDARRGAWSRWCRAFRDAYLRPRRAGFGLRSGIEAESPPNTMR
jgi:hypothetical protein